LLIRYKTWVLVAGLALSGDKFPRLDLVHITPDPGLPWLNGADEGMRGFVEMLRGVLVLGRIATAHVSANQAQAQVDPRVAGLNTFLTDMRGGTSEFELVEMGTFLRHRFLLRKEMIIRQVTSVM
jgi:hypothetical protein